MTVSYWDMAASIVNHGLVNEELFFESNSEFYAVWTKVKSLVADGRRDWKNPYLYKNLEDLADKFEKWLAKRAPGALPLMQERIKQMSSGGAKTS